MKTIKYLALLSVLGLFSCSKKEMKISRADKSIVTEVVEQSPIYINKNEDGTTTVNEKNRIGNTDWVFSIENSLPINSVLPDIQRLLKRKYDGGMHSDGKKAYLIYIDTVSNQIAYLPIDGLEFINSKPNTPNSLGFNKEVSIEKFIQEMVKVTTNDTLIEKIPVYIY